MPFSGARLAGIRDFKKLRRSDLARLTGMDPAGIQHLEEGATKNPRADTIETLAEKLDLTTDYLMGLGPDLPYAKAAVLQALERFKRTEGWKYAPLDEQALTRAAQSEEAFHTVAHWRAFVEMSNRAWGKTPRMLKVTAVDQKALALRPAKTAGGKVRRFDQSRSGGRSRSRATRGGN